MDDIVSDTFLASIAEAQKRRGEAEAEIARLHSESPVDMIEAEAAIATLMKAQQDLDCLQEAYENLGGDPAIQFS